MVFPPKLVFSDFLSLLSTASLHQINIPNKCFSRSPTSALGVIQMPAFSDSVFEDREGKIMFMLFPIKPHGQCINPTVVLF